MRYRYRTIEFGDLDIHLRTLRDTNEADDPAGVAAALGIPAAHWPLFGVVWTSSVVLAAMMMEADIAGRRILEIGCGIGLASMVLNHRGADITATDRHPEAERFLEHNAALNGESTIPFVRTDWRDEPGEELGRFSLIVGSDLLYDREQADHVARFVDEHALPTAEMILVDPGRGQAGAFTRAMEARGFAHTRRRAVDDPEQLFGHEVGARVHVHTFLRG